MLTKRSIHTDMKRKLRASSIEKLRKLSKKVFHSTRKKVHSSFHSDEEALAEDRKLIGPLETPTGVVDCTRSYHPDSKETIELRRNRLTTIEEISFDEETNDNKKPENSKDTYLESIGKIACLWDCFRFP
jgi:hypothetical protein